jgi:hypothetical protein
MVELLLALSHVIWPTFIANNKLDGTSTIEITYMSFNSDSFDDLE